MNLIVFYKQSISILSRWDNGSWELFVKKFHVHVGVWSFSIEIIQGLVKRNAI